MSTLPTWLLVTLCQLNLGQGLKPALAVAAEAGGGTSPLHQAYSDALLAQSVCVHTTKPTLGADASEVSGNGMSREQGILYPAQWWWPSPQGAGTALQLAELKDLAS